MENVNPLLISTIFPVNNKEKVPALCEASISQR